MFFWRANVLGASNREHEYFLRHLLGADDVNHETPSEIAQPFGRVKDWKKGETEPIPGKTMPRLKVVIAFAENSYLKRS
jgi:nitrate reductase alpha subunit